MLSALHGMVEGMAGTTDPDLSPSSETGPSLFLLNSAKMQGEWSPPSPLLVSILAIYQLGVKHTHILSLENRKNQQP